MSPPGGNGVGKVKAGIRRVNGIRGTQKFFVEHLKLDSRKTSRIWGWGGAGIPISYGVNAQLQINRTKPNIF